MNDFHSSIPDLNKAIASQNPFDRSLIVRSNDIWKPSFPDVPSINAHASDAIFQAIEQIRAGYRTVSGITIKAEKGLGKSHLISRIRRRLLEEGGSFFVYMSDVDYGNLNRVHANFLTTLSLSLKQIGNEGVMQWQELATALINEALGKTLIPQNLVKQFSGALAKNPKLVDTLTAKVLQIKPNIENPYLIQAILWTLASDKVSFATNWLSGKALAQAQADAMGLPNSTEEDKEGEAFQTVCQILDLIGDYRTLVIGFDELESVDRNEAGFSRAQVVALLVKDLYGKIKRGVLMTAIFDETWQFQIRALPQAESVTARMGEKIFDLQYLNADDVLTLVSQWLKEFYESKGLTPPYPVYPFNEGELRELGKERLIVRKVLEECAKNWKVPNDPTPPPTAADPLHQVELAFNNELNALEETIEKYFDDSNILAEALYFAFLALKGETVERLQVEEIEKVQTKAVDKGYLHFRVRGQEDGRSTKIVVAVVQESGAKFVSAALKRLIEYQKFDMTRGCLVRSKDVKPKTVGKQCLDQLLSQELGGEFVKLASEDIKPLLAIYFVNKARTDYDVTEDQILEFIVQKKLAAENYIICEILSDPSGQIPNGLVDENEIAESTSIPDTTEINNLDEALDNLLGQISG
ncbi:ATP-binding protein [Microcoleus vaginatus]|uniref:ATP-binding protein n=1 Tax=Microcoleus vaginatus TaxID=119532 RepID=UPI0032A7D6DD